MRRVVWGIVAMLMLAGCGTESAQPTANSAGAGSATATVSVAAPTQSAAPTAAVTAAPGGAPSVVATLETSGGIAGIMQRLVVWSDGKLELTNQGGAAPSIQLSQASPEQIQALQAAINRPEFKALGENYMPKDTCCDFFTYVLSTDDVTVTTMDGVEWPEPLRQTLELLFELQTLAPTQ